MKKILKALCIIVPAAFLFSVSIMATATDYYDQMDVNYTRTINSTSDTYVHQSYPNPFKSSTYLILNSNYEFFNEKINLTARYGAQEWDGNPRYRCSKVSILNSLNEVLSEEYVFVDASDVVSSVHISNYQFDEEISKVCFFGKCTIDMSTSYLRGEGTMNCTLILNK